MKRKIIWIGLALLAICIRVFSLFPGAVEKYYSNGLYLVIARLQRILFGWIPFSIGDIFYLVVAIWLVYSLVRFLRTIIKKKATRGYFWIVARKILFSVLLVYVAFNLCWGLNYDRKGIAEQLHLQPYRYETKDLTFFLQLIVARLNELDSAARVNRPPLAYKSNLFRGSVQSYNNLAEKDPHFVYHSPSVKPSIFSYLGNYLGFSGYYNPFSGEAQVNTTTPVFTQPFTTCHEIGHQLGYAKENEANLSGYLSARSSGDPAFRYSVYFDLYYYTATELYFRDSLQVKPLRDQLHPSIRKDFQELRQFYRRYQNPLEPLITHLYGNYLKANSQPQGMKTYNEVIAWVMAYYISKNGKEGI
ncbi:MAG TPA: DUF3810 domain-containing protein [Puia sp.]|nr:DUF3810 domain-containing protein [Puia sp.]